MSTIARTAATGMEGLLPELLAFSSSLEEDRAFLLEDLAGSAAHVTMLSRVGLVRTDDAARLRGALLEMAREATEGRLKLSSAEEDVHMAVEAELACRLGELAGRLHTARSRNDQVALDLRLFVRAQASRALGELTAFVDELLGRVTGEEATMVPAYTHRQRAQPVSVAFLMCAWSAQLLRAGRALRAAVDGANECPLGSGACSGTSLPIDRTIVAELLRFPRITHNALDTVGDRDFALDFAWAGARVLLALGKVAADLVDFSTAEFGLVKLDGRVATGSSMMPQKKNPDIFELVRGKSSRGIGNVVALLTLVKGLPSGYNRDQQEDRGALLGTAPLVRGTIDAMRRALPHAAFVGERGHSFVAEGFTQATDLAEALVRQGMPFREAYKAVGALVRHATTERIPLVEVDGQNARAVNPAFSDEVLAVLDPKKAMDAKRSAGGTSAESVGEQREALRAEAMHLRAYAESIPDTATLVASLAAAPLERPLNA